MEALKELDDVFKTLYYTICSIAKWIFAAKMVSQLIKQGEVADIQGSIKVLINGAFSYGTLYAIISVLELIQSKF